METLTPEDKSKLTRTARRLAAGASWEAIAIVLGFEAEKLRAFVDAHRAEFSRLLNRAYRETVTEALFEGIAVVRARLNDPDPAESRRAAECLIRVGLAFRRERATRLKERRKRDPWPNEGPLEPLEKLCETRFTESEKVDIRAVLAAAKQPSPTPAASPGPKVTAPPTQSAATPTKAQSQPRVRFASEKLETFAAQPPAKAKQQFDPAVATNWGLSIEALERIAKGEVEKGK